VIQLGQSGFGATEAVVLVMSREITGELKREGVHANAAASDTKPSTSKVIVSQPESTGGSTNLQNALYVGVGARLGSACE
jgi:hypothetical protein